MLPQDQVHWYRLLKLLRLHVFVYGDGRPRGTLDASESSLVTPAHTDALLSWLTPALKSPNHQRRSSRELSREQARDVGPAGAAAGGSALGASQSTPRAPDFETLSLRLLYRATRDGWSASDFHTRCDGRGPTITLVRCDHSGSTFGGFCSLPW